MKAGDYWIGDPCYVLRSQDVWAEVCVCLEASRGMGGEFVMSTLGGAVIAFYSTAYGDGIYKDQLGREYCVDAGMIGCVPVSTFSPDARPGDGNLVTFAQDFGTHRTKNGTIIFGDVSIKTSDE